MYPIVFLGFALIASIIHILLSKQKNLANIVRILLLYLVIFNIGLQGVFAAMGHIFFANQVAEQIGWPTGSPFQFEVGVANLALGIAALLAIFWRGYYLLGPVVVDVVFAYGASYGHFVQMAKGDTSPYNTGIFLYVGDIGITTAIFVLAVAYYFVCLRAK